MALPVLLTVAAVGGAVVLVARQSAGMASSQVGPGQVGQIDYSNLGTDTAPGQYSTAGATAGGTDGAVPVTQHDGVGIQPATNTNGDLVSEGADPAQSGTPQVAGLSADQAAMIQISGTMIAGRLAGESKAQQGARIADEAVSTGTVH